MSKRLQLIALTAAISACSASSETGHDQSASTAAALVPGRPSGPALVSGITWYLRNNDSYGVADATFLYGFANGIPVAGDWDGDGIATPGMYDPSTSVWYLRNSNTYGIADKTFRYGDPNPNNVPVVGDWDGNGTVTIGLYNRATSVWYLRNSNTYGIADKTFQYGDPNPSYVPVAGDWDGNGTMTIGLYNRATSIWYLRNSNTYGIADRTFQYGDPNPSSVPIVGDWTGSGTDTIGLYDSATSVWYLRNSNTYGIADNTFRYGDPHPGQTPVTGHWGIVVAPPPPPPSPTAKLTIVSAHSPSNDPKRAYITKGNAITLQYDSSIPGSCRHIDTHLIGKDYAGHVVYDDNPSYFAGQISVVPTANPTYYSWNLTCTDLGTSSSDQVTVDLYIPPTDPSCTTYCYEVTTPVNGICFTEARCSQSESAATQIERAQNPGANVSSIDCSEMESACH